MDRKRFFSTLVRRAIAPPQYTATHGADPSTNTSDDHSAPPPYYEQFSIPVRGKVPKDPFVSISQLKTHLGLLRAAKELKTRVTDLEANQDVRDKLPSLARELGPEKRWNWFLELALERCALCNRWAIFAEP